MSSSRQDPIVRMASLVGDFGNPFSAEERHRDVWNEASAFGFQLVIWCALAVGTGAVWVVGAPAVPYVSTVLVLMGAIATLTLAYAERLGVDLTAREHLLRRRLLPYALLVVALLVGLLRSRQEPLDGATVAGMVTGASVVLLVFALGARRRSGRA